MVAQSVNITPHDPDKVTVYLMSEPGTSIDETIDPMFLYGFIIIFANTVQEVNSSAQKAIHNLYEDGILWYVFPKNASESDEDSLTHKKGWNACKSVGFEPVRLISFDDKLSAIRFRNKKYIKRRHRK